jgi:hypothetical protein
VPPATAQEIAAPAEVFVLATLYRRHAEIPAYGHVAFAIGLIVMLALAACHGGSAAGVGRTDRERDSVIGQSKLPGARGVHGAVRAVAPARATNAPSRTGPLSNGGWDSAS